MAKTASKVVEQAKAWLGFNEADGSHKQIIDVYNSHRPLARGYAVKYTDAWCAAFVSAVSVKLGYTDIIPTECSCSKMISLFQNLGVWIEDDSRTPNPGDIIFYDWQDSGSGDNRGNPDHVGIVEKVSGSEITVIEGNYSNAVTRRTLAVNGTSIRGYAVPRYDAEPKPEEPKKEVDPNALVLPLLKKGAKDESVKAMQILLLGYGYKMGSYGADGAFGNKTEMALRLYQSQNGLEADGECGPLSWAKLLGIS
jgi:hypothetical protein